MSQDGEPTVQTLGPFAFDPNNGPPNLGEMIAQAMAAGNGGGSQGYSALEDVLPLLQAGFERYIASYGTLHKDTVGPFKPGDWVTAVERSALRGQGQPAIVLETRWQDPSVSDGWLDPSDRSSNSYGARQNIRILSENNGKIVAHWVETHELEFYAPPTE